MRLPGPFMMRCGPRPRTLSALRILPAIVLAFTSAATTGFAQSSSGNTEGWVVLPVGEYTALRLAAFPVSAEAAPPPVEATLSRLDYDLKVDGDLASGEAR